MVPGITKVQAVDEYLRDREIIWKELREDLVVAQERMKAKADQHHREVVFAVGDYVFLKLQPYRQNTVSFCSSLKLSPCFYSPYKILASIGPVAY